MRPCGLHSFTRTTGSRTTRGARHAVDPRDRRPIAGEQPVRERGLDRPDGDRLGQRPRLADGLAGAGRAEREHAADRHDGQRDEARERELQDGAPDSHAPYDT